MDNQRPIWISLSLLAVIALSVFIIALSLLTTTRDGRLTRPVERETNWLQEINTSLQDFRKGVAKNLEDLGKKFMWTTPSGTSTILEVLGSLQRTMALQNGRKITVRVHSEGYLGSEEEKGIAPLHGGPIFYVNETPAASNVRGRGFNILTISRENGTVLEAGTFDTCGSEAGEDGMWKFVKDAPDDTIVLVSVLDEASHRCKEKCYDAIREVGGTLTKNTFGYRVGYALIGYKGSYCGSHPPWMKEMKRAYLGENRRDGQGSMPLSLMTEIDLDHCYKE